MDLSIVASGGQLTVVRGASRPRAPTLQEPLHENARSTTCARQLAVARGESQRPVRPPTQLESLREKAGIAASAEPHEAARAKDPAMGELARVIEKLGELEPSVNAVPICKTWFPSRGSNLQNTVPIGEVPDDCDVEFNALLGALTIDQQERLSNLNTEILQVVDAMGGCRLKYARERRSAVRRLVSEIYSPPRVTAAAKGLPSFGCTPGFAMDLTTKDENGVPWDFDIPEQRRRARERVEQERPMLLIGKRLLCLQCMAAHEQQEA